jgi:hypothetical protein
MKNMQVITVGELIKELEKIPSNAIISGIGRGYRGDSYFFSFDDIHGKTIAEIPLRDMEREHE